MRILPGLCLICLTLVQYAESDVGQLEEVFSWNQLNYNINGQTITSDRDQLTEGPDQDGRKETKIREKRVRRQAESRISSDSRLSSDSIVFPDTNQENENNWTAVPDSRKFFIQYNNLPMGVEKWQNKLFVTVPRRRYGIPSTLNYLDLVQDQCVKSPGLRPFPGNKARNTKNLVSVYRTRVDSCNRLWMVDTGILEIPDDRQQVQPPAIVIFDLLTDEELLRYEFKSSDLVSERTSAGLASITVDVVNGDCSNTYAYVPDLSTYGLIVFSLRERDSWRVNHNYFSFQTTAGDLNIAGQQFQWNDGIFSITLGPITHATYRTAYFHPMVSLQEFAVSTEVLRNQTLATRSYHGSDFLLIGERGADSQSTMHAYDATSGAIFFAEVANDAITCWNTRLPLTSRNKHILAKDSERLVYPSDLHITDGEIWIMTNKLPRFGYSTLDVNETNFRIFRGNIRNMISGTVCQ